MRKCNNEETNACTSREYPSKNLRNKVLTAKTTREETSEDLPVPNQANLERYVAAWMNKFTVALV